MADTAKPFRASTRYQIVVHGEFGELLRSAFADASVSTGSGNSVLVIEVRDHQELYGLLDRLRDHGVDIVDMTRLDEPI